MKVNEVPQDDVPDYTEGWLKKGNYALDDKGKYVMVPSKGWVVDEMINRMAYDEYKVKEEETSKLKPHVLDSYAKALDITRKELKTVPPNNNPT